MYPDLEDAGRAVREAAERVGNPRRAYAAALRRLGYRRPDQSRIGGLPRWVHANSFEGTDFFLLAQIEYEVPANNCVGDAAPIFIGVSRSDPSRILTDPFQTH
jgi:hypothetical protein